MKWISVLLVIVQVVAIVILFVTGKPISDKPVLLSVQGLGLVLLIWTWIHLKPGKFHIMPDTVKKARLVTTGPFRVIRHPMYMSLFLYLVPLVINYFSYFRLAVLLAFCINMVAKLIYEEKLLKLKFPEYTAYMKKSYRLIPYVF